MVRADRFLGKPFLVHLPGQVFAAPGLRPAAGLDSRPPRNTLHSMNLDRSPTGPRPPGTSHDEPDRHPTDAKPSPEVGRRRRPTEKPKETIRDFVEQIVVAIILAILIRGFDAEAFVIPTGSMAPTLMGRHKEVTCPQCGYVYAVNASEETEDFVAARNAGRTVQRGRHLRQLPVPRPRSTTPRASRATASWS